VLARFVYRDRITIVSRGRKIPYASEFVSGPRYEDPCTLVQTLIQDWTWPGCLSFSPRQLKAYARELQSLRLSWIICDPGHIGLIPRGKNLSRSHSKGKVENNFRVIKHFSFFSGSA
jgi:hypothetical protein